MPENLLTNIRWSENLGSKESESRLAGRGPSRGHLFVRGVILGEADIERQYRGVRPGCGCFGNLQGSRSNSSSLVPFSTSPTCFARLGLGKGEDRKYAANKNNHYNRERSLPRILIRWHAPFFTISIRAGRSSGVRVTQPCEAGLPHHRPGDA